jgi:cold-inducible RNA-binding protein
MFRPAGYDQPIEKVQRRAGDHPADDHRQFRRNRPDPRARKQNGLSLSGRLYERLPRQMLSSWVSPGIALCCLIVHSAHDAKVTSCDPGWAKFWRKTLSKKMYVGNLSFEATEDQVRDLFTPYGTVESVSMITDRQTGQFRGFCFVEMETAAADAAITALNTTELDGRELKVNVAKPREDRPSNRGNGYRSH